MTMNIDPFCNISIIKNVPTVRIPGLGWCVLYEMICQSDPCLKINPK